jgi:hypothetical protein
MYAHCAPLAAYLLTWPLRPPSDATQHPYTAAHPMAEDHPPQHHHPHHLGHKSQAQRPHTLSNNRCNRPTSPAGNATKRPHTAITPTAQDRPPQCYHQRRTTCPTPPHHATWWPNPCMTHPCPTHGTLHCPERLPGQPPQPTPQADPPKLTPTRHADTPRQRLPANNSQPQLLDHPLGHLTTPNRHPPPTCAGPMPALLYILYLITCIVNI